MASINSILASAKGLGWGVLTWGLFALGVVVLLGFLLFIGMYVHRKKKWNLRVEVKLPRSDGNIILSEPAKGHYNSKAGYVDIKRKKMKPIGMKPFDVRKYLQGENYLEVIQLAPKDYIPVDPVSYSVLKANPSGEKKALLDIEADFGKRRTWKNYFERVSKERFTLVGFLQKHGQVLAFGTVIFIIFLGFAILWIRMPSICG